MELAKAKNGIVHVMSLGKPSNYEPMTYTATSQLVMPYDESEVK